MNKKECKLVTEKLAPVPLQYNDGIINPYFDKGIWISNDDFLTLYEAWLKDCKSESNKTLPVKSTNPDSKDHSTNR